MRTKCISRFYIGAPLAVTDCCVFVLFSRGAYLSAPLRRTNQAGGGIVSWFHWTFEMRWKAWSIGTGIPKRFSQKGFLYKPKDMKTLGVHTSVPFWVSDLDLPSLETQHFGSFQTPRFDTKKYAKGDTDLWLCKPIVWVIFWLKPWPWALKLEMRQKLKIISKQTSFLEIGFFPSYLQPLFFFHFSPGPDLLPGDQTRRTWNFLLRHRTGRAGSFHQRCPGWRKTSYKLRGKNGTDLNIAGGYWPEKIIMKDPFCWRYGRCHQHSLHLLVSMNGLALLARGFPHDSFCRGHLSQHEILKPWMGHKLTEFEQIDPKKRLSHILTLRKGWIRLMKDAEFLQRISWICEHHVK